jgi:hypothetical protein
MLQCDNRAVAGHIENFKAIFDASAQRPVQGLLEQVAGGCPGWHGPCRCILLHLLQYIIPNVESGSHRDTPLQLANPSLCNVLQKAPRSSSISFYDARFKNAHQNIILMRNYFSHIISTGY